MSLKGRDWALQVSAKVSLREGVGGQAAGLWVGSVTVRGGPQQGDWAQRKGRGWLAGGGDIDLLCCST